MGDRRAATLALAAFGATAVENQPLRPVSAQLEEIIEVNQTTCLEFLDHLRQHFVIGQRPKGDETFFDAKFIVRKVVPLIDRLPRQPAVLERLLPDEHYGPVVS